MSECECRIERRGHGGMWYTVTNSDMNRVLYCPRHAETHVAALTVQVAVLQGKLNMMTDRAMNMEARCARLMEAIRTYGQHLARCHLREPHGEASYCLSTEEHQCTCGLRDLDTVLAGGVP